MYPRETIKPKKTVTFHTTAFVVLIPTVEEYRQASLADTLWWNELDFHSFKVSAAKEVKEFMKTVPHMDAKKAMKLYFRNICEVLHDEEVPEPPSPPLSPALRLLRDCGFKRETNNSPVSDQEESEDEFDESRESEINRFVPQRHDSVTSSKLPRHPFQPTGYMDFEYEPTEERRTKPTSSKKSSNESSSTVSTDPFSMDPVSVFTRLMAVGVLVFMNRNTSH